MEKAIEYSPLVLAYIGDSVYDIFVRTRLVKRGNIPVGKLHAEAVKYVKAEAQATAYNMICESLTEEETAIFKRGRNATPGTVPKHAQIADYHTATGVEALIGYLYLSGNTKRVEELMELICEKLEERNN